mmetsp:Transcript_40798/g.66775  ORF Transcript_40798/g.66775 Transcript_40798/m.66775 type:complete len:83 (+) Transcript_40798:637-885(+)
MIVVASVVAVVAKVAKVGAVATIAGKRVTSLGSVRKRLGVFMAVAEGAMAAEVLGTTVARNQRESGMTRRRSTVSGQSPYLW